MPATRKRWYLGARPSGRQFALGTGDENAVADLRADLLGQIVAREPRRIGRVGAFGGSSRAGLRDRGSSLGRAGGDGVEQVADGALFGGNDALDEREAGARPTRDQDLPVDARARRR